MATVIAAILSAERRPWFSARLCTLLSTGQSPSDRCHGLSRGARPQHSSRIVAVSISTWNHAILGFGRLQALTILLRWINTVPESLRSMLLAHPHIEHRQRNHLMSMETAGYIYCGDYISRTPTMVLSQAIVTYGNSNCGDIVSRTPSLVFGAALYPAFNRAIS